MEKLLSLAGHSVISSSAPCAAAGDLAEHHFLLGSACAAGSRDKGSAVTRVGITGHSNLTVESVPRVADALRAELAAHASDGLVGVSCLARSADQLFARIVLELGGALEVVLPAADYRSRKVEPDNAAAFDDLIGKGTTVRTLPFETSNRDSYLAASEHVLSTVELIVAVWDGQPADGPGATGDARERQLPAGRTGPLPPREVLFLVRTHIQCIDGQFVVRDAVVSVGGRTHPTKMYYAYDNLRATSTR